MTFFRFNEMFPAEQSAVNYFIRKSGLIPRRKLRSRALLRLRQRNAYNNLVQFHAAV
jgi:hypothetical protein